MIQGVIFDLGNTLLFLDADYDQLETQMAEQLLSELAARGAAVGETFASDLRHARRAGRQRADKSNLEYTAEMAVSDTLARHGVCYLPEAVIPRLVARYFALEEQRWRAYPDARAALAQLKARGFKLALLSNATDHAFIERIARNTGVAEFFDPLYSSAGIRYRKPDPRAFQLVLDAWGLPPDAVVMVGDAPSFDVLGAHRAGIRAIQIGDGSRTPPPHDTFDDAHLMEPDAVICELAELPAALDALQRN